MIRPVPQRTAPKLSIPSTQKSAQAQLATIEAQLQKAAAIGQTNIKPMTSIESKLEAIKKIR